MGRVSMPQGKGSQLHNRREYEKIGRELPDNIDVSKSHENIILVDRDIREAYQEIFGEALEQYNAKQKRADRKIENYYDHIRTSKNGEKLFYEDVVQWGSKEDFQDPETRQKAKEALIEYVNTFQERNPNLKLIGAYIHMDEASPHLHLDYVPVAHGYTRGLATRNSLDKAMKEMGFQPEKESRKNNATKLWKESERAYFADLCRSRGLEVEAERKARGSLSVEEYKEARDEILGDIEQEYAEKKAQIENLDEIAVYIGSEGREAVKAEDMTLPERKSFWGKVEAPERVGVFVENMDKGQVEALMQRVKVDERIEDTLERTQQECRQIIETAKKEAESIKAEATAEKNETIANAEAVMRKRNGILARAKAWAENLKKQYEELVGKVKELLGQKETLETEVSGLQVQKEQLEPLRAEVQELMRARDILTGAVENEINQSKFYVPSGGLNSPDYNEKWARFRSGELLALYRDGQIRTVTKNQHGGFDDKTLADERAGLCRIGWFKQEERVLVPRNLLKELIAVRDRAKPITQNLENMIAQQNTVKRVISKVKEQGRSR